MSKIAFCFLTYSDLDRSFIWQKYLENNLDKCNIYIHPKYPLKNSFFKRFVLPKQFRTKTYRKSDIFIVYATLLLLSKAVTNPENKKIIFLSQSCLPIVSFNELYDSLMVDDCSYIKRFPRNKMERYHQLGTPIKKLLKSRDFTKQHPNMILDRNHALYFATKPQLLNLFKSMECPDEHYFINIINCMFPLEEIDKVKDYQICFCSFKLTNTQGIEHKIVSRVLVNKLRNMGYFFMRKVTGKSVIYPDYIKVIQ